MERVSIAELDGRRGCARAPTDASGSGPPALRGVFPPFKARPLRAGDCSAFGAWSPQHVQRWMWLPGQVDQPILAQSPQVRLYGMKGPEPCCLAKASNFSRFAPGRLKPCTMTDALLNAPCPSDGHGWCCTMKGEFARCMCVPRSSEILEIQYPSMLSCSGQQAKLDFFGPCRRDVAATTSGVRMSSSRYVVGTVSCASKFPRRRETANVAALTIGHGGKSGSYSPERSASLADLLICLHSPRSVELIARHRSIRCRSYTAP